MTDELNKWFKAIENLPGHCTYCRANIEKGKEQRFEIQQGRNEAFCNIDCAIAETKKRKNTFIEASKLLEDVEIKLTYQKYQGKK